MSWGDFTFLELIWAAVLVIVFFGGSIFIHELGHFLAARWRGLKIDRFSIGFGPRLFGWKGKDGVDYRVSLIPFGGYVALPQLADMRGIEGSPSVEKEKLPPISYSDKMYTAVAGAVFNVLFAIALAMILWAIGTYTSFSSQTTTIGYVTDTVTVDGEEVPSPASEAGLKAGDEIVAVDGSTIEDWEDLVYAIVAGTGRSEDGRPEAIFTIRREGALQDFTVYPAIATAENIRQVGISARDRLLVGSTHENSPAAKAGVQSGWELKELNGEPILSAWGLQVKLEQNPTATYEATFATPEGEMRTVSLQPEVVAVTSLGATKPALGLIFERNNWLEHVNPIEQIERGVDMTAKVLYALLHRGSNIGLSTLSGPVGISYALFKSALIDIRFIIKLAVLINISLAILNLLPIPVLDGGHMAFATIAKLRGKQLSRKTVRTAESVQLGFMYLLFGLMIYIAFHDVMRVGRDVSNENEIQKQIEERITPVFDGQNAEPQSKPATD